MNIFCVKLKELRVKNGLSLSALSEKANISAGTIGKWENGKIPKSISPVIRLSKFFGVTVDYLLGRD